MIKAAHELTQRGSVLVLLLMLLAGMGAMWFAKVGANGLRLLDDVPVNTARALKLKDAQQSLLSYAALYPFLYGPRGAGPGHLPCPDTDAVLGIDLTDVPRAEMSAGRFSPDGPNPPCGSGQFASGKLPRHVLLADQRYLFHSEPTQSMSYQVSSSHINNPTNRVFNAGLQDSDGGGALTIAATLSLPASPAGAPPIRVPVFQRAMVQGVKPLVAAWIIKKADETLSQRCAASNGSSEPDKPITHSFVRRASDNQRCFPVPVIKPQCADDTVLSLIVDGVGHSDQCLAAKLNLLTIDGVPANRHWFIRNQWPGWIQIAVSPDCTQETPMLCTLRYQNFGEAERASAFDSRIVHLQWLP